MAEISSWLVRTNFSSIATGVSDSGMITTSRLEHTYAIIYVKKQDLSAIRCFGHCGVSSMIETRRARLGRLI